jgi:hydrogenase maturation factor
MFPDRIGARFGPDCAAGRGGVSFRMSVVADARVAASVGTRDRGVAPMHDATSTVLGRACTNWRERPAGPGRAPGRDRIHPGVREVCAMFGIDPFTSISEGTLIIIARPHAAPEILRRL